MLDKLNHYSLTNPGTVYDEEAMTALELAGRTAAKANETVEAFNKLEKETGEHLDNQDTRITAMNDVTMPAKVTQEFKKNLDNGTFENMVDEYAGELTARLDNLAHTLTPGSTTGDAELIDGRVDMLGRKWDNVGTSARAQGEYLQSMAEPTARPVLTEIALSINPGYYTADGVWHENFAGHNHRCAAIPVQPGETYYLSNHYGLDFPDAVGVYSDGRVKPFHQSPAVTENNMEKPCHIDAGMVELRINGVDPYPLHVFKVTGYEPVIGWRCINDMVNLFPKHNHIVDEIAASIKTSHFLEGWSFAEVPLVNPDNNYKTATLSVKPGEIYHISASCGTVGNHYYIIYTANEKVAAVETCEDNNIQLNKMLIMPEGAAKIIVSGHGINPRIGKVQGFNYTRSLSHLKWACMGDSLTEHNVRTDKNYHDYVHDKTGIQVVNLGSSGAGYARKDGNGATFRNQVDSIPDDTDVVTIFGGANDLASGVGLAIGNPTDTGTDTICGAINATINAIYSRFPTVQLGIVAPTPWINNAPENNGTLARLCEALEAICKHRGIPFLDLFHGSGLRPNDAAFRALAYSKDDGSGVHPDETGHKMISGHFMTFLDSLIGAY